jgi:hypothetical protein
VKERDQACMPKATRCPAIVLRADLEGDTGRKPLRQHPWPALGSRDRDAGVENELESRVARPEVTQRRRGAAPRGGASRAVLGMVALKAHNAGSKVPPRKASHDGRELQ